MLGKEQNFKIYFVYELTFSLKIFIYIDTMNETIFVN